ncbi:MAG: cyclic beta 1-2 glucan synthetase [Arenimonas sp.]|uniref:glycoside hydrolase family 94 protein n=1 Tax=Arenimonas sp. TaxID=1872635 RepID=UPI0025C5A535|nr:glycoside hydrolase family 94 protein [Arenimonas sp.]MBW8367064.1 cyclic beta 1-2 glucan synthetase [Arenimonas sp.]
MPSATALIRLRIRLRRLLAGPVRQRSRNLADPPVRVRLLSAEQLGERGADLARSHTVDPKARTDRLLRRLVDNQLVIGNAVAMLEEAVQSQRRLTPAGEWLIDNIHLVEEQVRIARRHFPKGYSRELPQLASGPSAGFPRVYDIALTAISHGDGRIDTEGLSGLVAAYQKVTPLGLGELWALPIMLRLALIENLRRISVRIIADRADRNLADEWADRLIDVAQTDPKHLVLVLADMVRSGPPMASSFVAELVRRLHGQGAALVMPLAWIEQWLADAGHGTEHLVQVENQHQAADQVSVSNAIGSVRYLGMMDWREFVEAMSLVEHRLREDPAGTYGQMDFATRDQYRHVVERLARRGKRPEVDVAAAAVALAQARADEAGTEDVRAHVGYYLIEAGLAQLQHQVAPRRHRFGARDASIGAAPMSLYLLPIAAMVSLSTWGLLGSADGALAGRWLSLLAIALAVVAFSELGISLVNWIATQRVLPRTLPRLDFSKGIPPHARTLVVVPTMFGNTATLAALVEALEVRFLANRDENLHFALLTDFFDADAAVMPGDDALLDAAQREIDALNLRYAPEHRNRFFLFHRPRLWNERERRFIAYERKRGKLAALNRLLRRGKGDDFLRVVGDTNRLGHVRYVITLDTDTQLPRDAGRKFAGTLAHPLNRARFDEKRNRVTRGYGILQPRVGSTMSGQRRSWYARIHGTEPGLDPYTRAVSDVYQDLFAEGSFVGKGIYDVDAFEHSLHQRFPDNSVLSHDLLEGCYIRAGLVSDVQLYEDYPARYSVDVKRRHRWIRGDWQLLPWLLPSVPRGDGRRERNPLSALSRGKILDNLRRSLVPTAMVGLLLLGWLALPAPLAWTLWVLSILFLPPLLAGLRGLLLKPQEMTLATHLRQAAAALVEGLRRAPVMLACLPYESWFSLDAIARTLWRLAVSRRHLLQWAPSSEVERTAATGWWASVRSMAIAPVSAVAVGLVVQRFNPAALWVALPVLALWFASPLLMEWLGRPRARKAAALSSGQSDFLGRLARRTWLFFETHVGPDDHWLPPDNMQEHPAPVVAHRTSPTNIGLALLANLTALDFGYLSAGGMAARTAATLATLQSLPRYRGHFYNWYDTQTLEPLPPRYLSSVDSGNLAGHLATLRQGLLALPAQPVISPRLFQGLADTFGLLSEAMGSALPLDGSEPLATLQAAIALPPQSIEATHARLEQFASQARRLVDMAQGQGDEARFWAGVLLEQCLLASQDLLVFAPWLEHGDAAPALPWSDRIPSLTEIASLGDGDDAQGQGHVAAVVRLARTRLRELARLADVAADCGRMDFGFLYDPTRELLSIGYCVDDRRLDSGYYDLLASEARLGSFVAIAQGQLPQESWFALGRLLTAFDGHQALLSWSGSMFEYLMPQLVMPSYEGTLLDETARASVERQIAYGRDRGVPWGISESGYNTVDARMNYQYRAFGVPGLGLQRGLGQDLVIAPYASMLALMVAPEEACSNLQRLEADGYGGRFGLYEAIDFTPARLPRGQKSAIVRSYMAHHQGMGLLSLSYLLHDQPMQRRFSADPEFQATLLLLQERVPRTGTFHPHVGEVIGVSVGTEPDANQLRIFRTPDTVRPAVQMLSNGRYHVLVTGAGGGHSRLREMAVTRWREDPTRDHWGNFCYLRDVSSGEFWSTAYQPACVPVEGYEAIFSDAKAEFRGRHLDFETHTEIAVSAEDDIELRRLVITNRGRTPREIEITSYAEVVLAPAISDELHPAFSNLFVQTELLPAKQAILCTRRPRAHDEVPPWMFQLMAVHNADVVEISYESDRARFIGRGNTLARPDALTRDRRLSGSQGSVLDPIVATRCRIVLAPEQTATIDMVMGVGADRTECTALIDKYRDRHLADRVFDLAWTHSQVVRRQIDASQADAQLYERLAGLVLYAHPAMRAAPSLLLQNRRGQSGLWGHAISGDLPIVLLKIADAANIELVRQLVQAHAYWRLKGLAVDLVIWNEDQAGYRQALQDLIMGLIGVGVEAQVFDRPGGIFVRPAQQISHEDRILLQSVARVIVSDADGSLADQVGRRPQVAAPMPLLATAATPPPAGADDESAVLPPMPALQFDNGLGGFSADGREYVVRLLPGRETPAPWSNVLANPQFGTVVTESGSSYTWAENAHEFRLTPWHNDPVGDTGGEAFYLRDEDSGRHWSPSPLPRRGEGEYRTRHGFGYTVYEHVEDGIASELWVYVARHDAVKFSVLKLRNLSGRRRDLSVTGYVEWVLGDLRARSHLHVVTEREIETGLMTARNAYSDEFGGRVAFFDADADATGSEARWGEGSVTGDRNEFLGRNGSLAAPAALRREALSGRCGAGLDPCTAIQRPVTLAVGAESQVVFRLGLGHDAADAQQLAQRHRGGDAARRELEAVQAYWTQTLGAVQVHTPEPALDLLANGWLLYQTIACRYHARSGFYQSGGAYGFRDQLQDTMAMLHAEPALAREHLLRCAAHQFSQGDVQHWWHPPLDRGVRTRCSDDYLWLPLAACRYVETTGDGAVMDERVHYLEGRTVNADEESYYDLPMRSGEIETVYGHCVRSLQRGLSLLGERGLPLIATGDWNDGMNRVGEGGKGESVWLGFFLHDALLRFSPLARSRGDGVFADRCLDAAEALRQNLETHGWDGAWYRRAWFDDGTPLGSTSSPECRIDSIAQSWSVLSGAGDPARARQAMASLSEHLVRRDTGVVQLLDPPFDKTPKDPGYIRGYVPGVRENGGQYTHAAIWATMAFAELGDRERAWELLRMINPINHALDAAQAAVYKVEPYVVAADVYAVAPHVGRGGWTWYTGSAGWMYRLMTESLLGLRREGDTLRLTPCLPADWPGFEMDYRFGTSVYRLQVVQAVGATPGMVLDGVALPGLVLPLRDDGVEHRVHVTLAAP